MGAMLATFTCITQGAFVKKCTEYSLASVYKTIRCMFLPPSLCRELWATKELVSPPAARF